MGRTITYSELESMVRSFARVLSDMGIGPGDKVAVCLPNIPQAIIANYAVFRIGAVAVLCNPLYTERELAYQLNDSDAKIIVTLTLLVPRIEKIKDQTKIKKIIACHIHSFLPFPKKQLFPLVKKEMFRKITPTDTVKLFTDLIRGKSMTRRR
ncbi:MAG: AMP-binding protein [Desulfobacterales bacterium]